MEQYFILTVKMASKRKQTTLFKYNFKKKMGHRITNEQ